MSIGSLASLCSAFRLDSRDTLVEAFARIAPWLAVTTCWLMSRLLQTIKFDGVRNNEIVAVMVRCKYIIKGQFEKTYYRPLKTEIFINNTFIL